MGKFNKSKSYVLTSCLVAISFAIINCQKAPNRNGVKPNVTAPAGTNTKAAEGTGKAQCSSEIKNGVEAMRAIIKETKVTHESSSGKSDSEKQALNDKRIKLLDNCVVVTKELEKIAEKNCLIDKNSKATAQAEIDLNNVTLKEMKQTCDATCGKLKEDGKSHTYTCAAATATAPTPVRPATGDQTTADAKKKEKERKDRATEYLAKAFTMSDELKDVITDDKTFGKYLVGGEIKTDNKALELANSSAKTVVCSIAGATGFKIDKNVSKSIVVKFQGEYSEVKGETALDGFKGDAMSVVLTRVNDKSEKAMLDGSGATTTMLMTLTCLNIKASSIDVSVLKKAIEGRKALSHITEAELKKQTDDNERRLKQAAADEAAARVAEEARRRAGAASAPATPNAASVAAATAAAEKKAAALTALRSAQAALVAQKAKVENAPKAHAAATEALSKFQDANKTLLATKDSGLIRSQYRAIEKEILEARDAQKKVDTTKPADVAAATLKVTQAEGKARALAAKYKSVDIAKLVTALDELDKLVAAKPASDKASAEDIAKVGTLEKAVTEAAAKAKADGVTEDEIKGIIGVAAAPAGTAVVTGVAVM